MNFCAWYKSIFVVWRYWYEKKNFDPCDEFVKDLYRTNIKAGVDYMEFGYKASKDIFSKDDYGKWIH